MLIVVQGSRKTMSITQHASQKPVAKTFPARVCFLFYFILLFLHMNISDGILWTDAWFWVHKNALTFRRLSLRRQSKIQSRHVA